MAGHGVLVPGLFTADEKAQCSRPDGLKEGSGAQFHLIILHERWRVSFQPDVGAELLGEWLTVGQPRFSRSVTFRPPLTLQLLPYILFRVHPPSLN